MPKISVKVMRGGEPVKGAKVYVGDFIKGVDTNKDGVASKTVGATWGPVVASVIVEGEGFSLGQGPVKLERDKELVIEV